MWCECIDGRMAVRARRDEWRRISDKRRAPVRADPG
jgi:hypothetical protein